MKLSLSFKHIGLIWLTGVMLAAASVTTVFYYESKQMKDQLERRLEKQAALP
ncbi:hypothetical protein QW180_26760 [Vibrio sinaloensis]|nr:hypothetical protein [Vibrio sinaloensis]